MELLLGAIGSVESDASCFCFHETGRFALSAGLEIPNALPTVAKIFSKALIEPPNLFPVSR
jgi:hypothetical protein